jgi:hypothetical protein
LSITEEKRAVLRWRRSAAIACVALVLLAVCLAGQVAADGPPMADQPTGGGTLASVRLVLAVLLATTVAAVVVVGLWHRTSPR